jgi:hypothetical protein
VFGLFAAQVTGSFVIAGAVAFATTNVRGAFLAVAIIAALALWTLYREKRA